MSLSRLRLRGVRPWVWALIGLASLAPVRDVQAAGYEDTINGTLGLGRAASFGRVQDFMATWQNPANLAVVPGVDVGLELRLTVFDACFDRVRVMGVEYRDPRSDDEGLFQGSETFQNVCNEAPIGPSGNIGWAQKLSDDWGIGAGLFTPGSVGSTRFGKPTIVTWPPYFDDEQYDITREGDEWPNRALGIDMQTSGAWLALGAGVRLLPELRVGLGLAAGYVQLKSTQVASVVGGTFRDQEYLTEVDTTDWFVPRAILSVVGTPLPSLDLYGIAIWQDDVVAKGDVIFTANGIRNAPLGNCRDAMPGPHCGIQDAKAFVPFPNFEVTVGARYAARRVADRPVLDPMRDELWDVELNASWTATSHVKDFTLQLFEGEIGPGTPKLQTNSTPMSYAAPFASTSSVPKRWKDTLSVRVGGDLNVVRSRLALRGGLSYASSAVPLEYMNIDVWPVRKVGVHLGATLAFGPAKLSVGYAHIFFESVQVPEGYGQVVEATALFPERGQAVNEGDYEASQDVLSVQANWGF